MDFHKHLKIQISLNQASKFSNHSYTLSARGKGLLDINNTNYPTVFICATPCPQVKGKVFYPSVVTEKQKQNQKKKNPSFNCSIFHKKSEQLWISNSTSFPSGQECNFSECVSLVQNKSFFYLLQEWALQSYMATEQKGKPPKPWPEVRVGCPAHTIQSTWEGRKWGLSTLLFPAGPSVPPCAGGKCMTREATEITTKGLASRSALHLGDNAATTPSVHAD